MAPPSGVQQGNIVDVSGGMVVRPNPVRSYLPQKYWNRRADFFCNNIEFNTLGVSATQTDKFQVDVDQDFLCLALGAVETTTAAGTTEQTFWPVLVDIFENTGANWFGLTNQLHNVFGRATGTDFGYKPLPYPRFVSGGSTVSARLQNLEATARRIWLIFLGVQIFREDA